jgi:hypothetical protein
LTQLLKTKQEIENTISQEFQTRGYDCSESDNSIECNEDCVETPIVLMSPAVDNPHHFFDNVTKFEILDSNATLIYFATIQKGIDIQTYQTFI